MKEYLIAMDIEGVHGVCALPYNESPIYALPRTSDEYKQAVVNATREVNAVVDELFACGAEQVYVWDNHGGGGNLDFAEIDPRAKQLVVDAKKPRMEFLSRYHFDGILYIGYHTRAGTPRGILSHTYNSIEIQYYKINGKQVGEFDIDSWIAACYGVPAIFAASDDVCVGQILEHSPETVTAITKYGVARRKAIFRDEDEVLAEIRAGVRESVNKKINPVPLTFPCEFEIRYTKQELAEWFLESLGEKLPLRFGEDANTLCATFYTLDDLHVFR